MSRTIYVPEVIDGPHWADVKSGKHASRICTLAVCNTVDAAKEFAKLGVGSTIPTAIVSYQLHEDNRDANGDMLITDPSVVETVNAPTPGRLRRRSGVSHA